MHDIDTDRSALPPVEYPSDDKRAAA